MKAFGTPVKPRWAAAAEEDTGQGGPQDSGTGAEAVGSIDESEKAFDSAERRIAELLKSEGREVRALRESPQHWVRTPDATVDGTPTEFESLREGAGSSTVKNALNSAKAKRTMPSRMPADPAWSYRWHKWA